MKSGLLIFTLCAAAAYAADSSGVTIHTAIELRSTAEKLLGKNQPFASADLGKYGNHYFMLAAREKTGSSELHEHEADVFVVERGEASFITGGKMVNPHTTAPGEIRGTSIEGGERRTLSPGDVVHVPAGIPHQVILDKGTPFVYFVVKVSGQ